MSNILNNRLFDNEGLLFTDGDGNKINDVTTVYLDDKSNITYLRNINEEDITEFNYEKYVLDIPGVGSVTPGTRVVWKDEDYILLFGWHKNISNQEIFSWYIDPLEYTGPSKTLYKWMVNEIELVHFR